MTVDVDLGGSVSIPLAPADADGLGIVPAEVSVYVKLPDTTTVGPLTVTQADLSRQVLFFTTTQTGQHRYRVVETSTDVQVREGQFYVWPTYADHTSAWAPLVTDVAALVPTRTMDTTGTTQNTFTASTTPTLSQVNGYIAGVVAEIEGYVGGVPGELFEAAKRAAELGVASLIERTYPPTTETQNVANDFRDDYQAALKRLYSATRGASGGRSAVSVELDSYSWPAW